VQVRATDAVGNVGMSHVLYTFNQKPDVQTMLDTSTPIADPLQLNATADDDGFLNPLTYAWTQVSGPGTANFSPGANVLEPTVTFTNIGTYVLRLTVNDGFFTVSDDITITVFHEPPVVNAGPDQSFPLALPSVTASLAGSATDDGFLGPLAYTWSGPPSVVFGDPSKPATTATFSASGEYTLKLEAFDGTFTSSDTVTINVINDAPVVDAGPDVLEVDFGFLPISLNGTVTDDGFPTPSSLKITWTKTSGPGNVAFSNPNSPDTNVTTLSQAGTYVLRLEAFDGEKTSFSTITIHYGAPPRYGLVPCGVIIDDPDTPYDETDPCALRHFFLLLKNLIDFALWKLIPLIIAILAIATGVIFYFSLGSANTLTLVRSIWRGVIKGVIILLFSWLFLNLLLSLLGFQINIFGHWTTLEL